MKRFHRHKWGEKLEVYMGEGGGGGYGEWKNGLDSGWVDVGREGKGEVGGGGEKRESM